MSRYTIYARYGHTYTTNDLSQDAAQELERAVTSPGHGEVVRVSIGVPGARTKILTIRATDIISIAEHLS